MNDDFYIDPELAHSLQPKIDRMKNEGEWNGLVDLLMPVCQRYKMEYYFFYEISRAYYQLRNFSEALKYADAAYDIEKHDVIVLYARGMALHGCERHAEALDMFDRILRKNAKRTAYGIHGEGMWTFATFNDARYMKSVCFMEMGDYIRARRYIKLHLTKRRRGMYSGFSKRQVLKRYNKLLDLIEKSKKAT